MNEEKVQLGIITGEQVRKLLMEHPELPIAFEVDMSTFTGEYDYEYASSVTAQIGEILDCYQDIDGCIIFSDRNDFEDRIRDDLSCILTINDDFEAEVSAKLAEYEPYWKKCIIVTVGN